MYQNPPAQSPAGRRPATVTAAGYLLFGVAVLVLVTGVLPLPYAGEVADTAKRAYANVENGNAVASVVGAAVYGTSIVYIIAAIGLAVLGLFDLRGSNGARITTWVIGGIGVLCCGSGTLLGGVTSGVRQSTTTTGQATQEAQRQVAAVYPSWYGPVTTTLAVLALLALIALIILLALPASHPYFKRGRGQGHFDEPGFPSLPPYPGGGSGPSYPHIGGEPPAPPAPPAQRDE